MVIPVNLVTRQSHMVAVGINYKDSGTVAAALLRGQTTVRLPGLTHTKAKELLFKMLVYHFM